MEITAKHKLRVECRVWHPPIGWPLPGDFYSFHIGSCEGLYQPTVWTYDIYDINNSEPGNGHFEDVLQWFQDTCRREKKDLRFLWGNYENEDFRKHLIRVRQFKVEPNTRNLIKAWKYL